MQVDILSDLHLDFYFYKNTPIREEDIFSLFNPIITKNGRKIGDALLIAGDIGHYNLQNITVLKYLKKKYYSHIVCVLGNHDYYLLSDVRSQFKNSFERAENMRTLINQEEGMHCLNGEIIDIQGIKFGGCDSWYNRGYVDRYCKDKNISKETITQIWKENLNDYRYIYGLKHIKYFDEIFEIEKPKLDAIYKKVDVMITHVSPSTNKENFPAQFRTSFNNVFFSFEGEKYLRETTASHWVFGHSHDTNTFMEHGVTCHCNTLGYPGESADGYWTVMKSFEI